MTRAEYSAYQERVDQFFRREGLSILITVDGEEPFLSQYGCDLCGGLPGSVYSCYGFVPATGKVRGGFEVCPSCIFYCEYGSLPADIEIEEKR